MSFFEELYEYYYLILILQAVCVFHSIRSGNQQKWIWIIVFLPLIGCIAYIFTEVVKRQHVSVIRSTAASFVNPGGRIGELEKRFKFSDTFTNRVALADAYLVAGMNEKAIELYEQAGKGVFEDEHVVKQLILAYYKLGRFGDVIAVAPKIAKGMNFTRSQASLFYARSLEHVGRLEQAEKHYQAMNHRYENYEARYYYGNLLLKLNRKEDAGIVFYDIVQEGENMSRREKGASATWISKAKEDLKKIVS